MFNAFFLPTKNTARRYRWVLSMLAVLLIASILIQPVFAQDNLPTIITDTEAKRFLARTTFGPIKPDVEQLQTQGYQQWLDAQLNMPRQQKILNRTIEIALMAEPNAHWFSESGFLGAQSSPVWIYQNSAWWEAALTAPDQLRQRVAFALSEILVISSAAEPYLRNRAEGVAAYYDLLLDHAFGNYRDLLSAITYSPAMGVFLSHHGNKKANPKRGTAPDENYARELMQLFSIGLYKLNSDGTPILDEQGELIPVYTQNDVMELARVFTGWDMVGNKRYGQRNNAGGNLTVPMEFNKEFHDADAKTLLGQTIPAGVTGKEDIEAALNIIFSQPEVGPFVCKHLIQRLVMSNPSADYLQRTVNVFNNNGNHVRGDLRAVITAILLDPEALKNQGVKKFKEPIIATTAMLRALGVTPGINWQTPKGGDMHGVYWFRKLNIGQNPLMAPSVFNYYEPDFQPANQSQASDDDTQAKKSFNSTGQVAPEAQIIDSQLIIGFGNLVHDLLNKPTNQERLIKRAWHSRAHINLNTQTYTDLLQAPPWPEQKPTAIHALVQQLEHDILTEPLDSHSRTLLENHLTETVHKKTEKEAQRIVNEAIRLLVTVPEYWVQR